MTQTVMFTLYYLSYIHPRCLSVVVCPLRVACIAIIPRIPSNQRLAIIKDVINLKVSLAVSQWLDALTSEFLDGMLIQVQMKNAAYICSQPAHP